MDWISIGSMDSWVGRDEDILHEIDQNMIEIGFALGVIYFDFDIDVLSLIADISWKLWDILLSNLAYRLTTPLLKHPQVVGF